MDSSSRPLCPSGRCRAGSTLLGIMGPSGNLIYTPQSIALDEQLAEKFDANGGSSRYRFAEPCATDDCGHWSDEGCGVAKAGAAISDSQRSDRLPPCGIRSACRWFAQEGPSVCAVCPHVLRNGSMVEEQSTSASQEREYVWKTLQ